MSPKGLVTPDNRACLWTEAPFFFQAFFFDCLLAGSRGVYNPALARPVRVRPCGFGGLSHRPKHQDGSIMGVHVHCVPTAPSF